MIPVEANEAQVAWWEECEGIPQNPMIIGGPHEGDDVIPCPALVALCTNDDDTVQTLVTVVHVAYKLDEIELARLAQGGTLWLTTYGGLPVHRVEVGP